MKAGVRWVLLRTGLYVVVAVAGITMGGYLYSGATGTGVLDGSRWSVSNLVAWLNVGGSVATAGGGITLVLLGLLAPFRKRVTPLQAKLLLLPFLLLPILFLDLIGTSPSFTLALAGMQVFYLIIMPTGSRAELN